MNKLFCIKTAVKVTKSLEYLYIVRKNVALQTADRAVV